MKCQVTGCKLWTRCEICVLQADASKTVETCDRKDIPVPVIFHYNIEERLLAFATILYERKAEFMTEIMLWMAENQALLVMVTFGLVQVILLIILLVTAHRVRMMKKEMDKIGTQVRNYLDVVLENEETDAQEQNIIRTDNTKRDEEENRIISTVLQEIFP